MKMNEQWYLMTRKSFKAEDFPIFLQCQWSVCSIVFVVGKERFVIRGCYLNWMKLRTGQNKKKKKKKRMKLKQSQPSITKLYTRPYRVNDWPLRFVSPFGSFPTAAACFLCYVIRKKQSDMKVTTNLAIKILMFNIHTILSNCTK